MPITETPDDRRRVWLDVIIGITVVAWGCAVAAIALTHHWKNAGLSQGLLACASVLTLVVVILIVAESIQRRREADHRAVMAGIAANHRRMDDLAGLVIGMHRDMPKLGDLGKLASDSKWVGYARAVKDLSGEDTGEISTGGVVPLRTNGQGRRP